MIILKRLLFSALSLFLAHFDLKLAEGINFFKGHTLTISIDISLEHAARTTI